MSGASGVRAPPEAPAQPKRKPVALPNLSNLFAMDISTLREQFPILKQPVHGMPLVYLDNAATTQKPLPVTNRLDQYYRTLNSNIHRGVHFLSQEATQAYETARSAVARFMGAGSSRQILFTKGTTESINLVANGYAQALLGPGDRVIVSIADHHSNFVPWQQACLRSGAAFSVVPVLPEGAIDQDALRKELKKGAKLLALPHISNVLGIENPLKEIIGEAHRHGCAVLVDGAQAIAHTPVNVAELDCDFYCWSGHKAYGPTGIGILYGKTECLEALPPYQFGGEMIGEVSIEQTTFAELPFKFEAGTPPIAEAIALEKALDFIQETGFEQLARHEAALVSHAFHRLQEIPGMKIHGGEKNRSGVISFNIDGAYHYDVGVLLDQLGVAVRTGHHCAQPLMKHLSVPGTVRCSFACYNTLEEIDRFIQALGKAASMLR